MLLLILILIITTILFQTKLEHFTTQDTIQQKLLEESLVKANKGINISPYNVYYHNLKNKDSISQRLIEKEFDILNSLINKFTKSSNKSNISFSLTNSNDIKLDTQIENVIFNNFTRKLNTLAHSRVYKQAETIESDIQLVQPNIYKFVINFILFEKTTSFSIPIKIIGNIDNFNRIINYNKVELNWGSENKSSNIKPSNQYTNYFKIQNTLHLLPPFKASSTLIAQN